MIELINEEVIKVMHGNVCDYLHYLETGMLPINNIKWKPQLKNGDNLIHYLELDEIVGPFNVTRSIDITDIGDKFPQYVNDLVKDREIVNINVLFRKRSNAATMNGHNEILDGYAPF